MSWSNLIGASCIALAAAAASGAGDAPEADSAAIELFESRIRPVLAETCFRCHGGEKTAHDLRVDSREALLKGGRSGPAVVPGRPEESLLFSAIEHRDGGEFQMPPGSKLPAETIAAFAAWIRQGAAWPADRPGANAFESRRHWAYRPVQTVALPAASAWSDHPVDRFIAAGWSARGLKPAPPAERRALIRRLYFDLWGLPPTPGEIDAALADPSPDAWPRLIDRLLESPHYGERWGRYWMDVVRYADTAGDNADYPVPEARLYRDYLIDSFNADKPFDQFIREQIAGDLLAAEALRSGGGSDRFAEQTIATGFIALSRRYATGPYELWHLTLEDTIDTVGRAFLGLTFKCARCHDHKFDPVTQEDYYALYGIFASTQFPWAGGEEFHSKQIGRMHFPPLLPDDDVAPRLREHQAAVEELQAQIQQAETDGAKDRVKELKRSLRDVLRSGGPAGVPCAYAVRDAAPTDVPLQRKGDPAQPGPVIPRRMPAFLDLSAEPIPAGQSGRLQLARWLTRPDHPLTARVMVNRIWQHHFGKGIVATPSNFGTSGEPPTHPELLDFLAGYFIDHGWSVKAVHRLILTSQTWQLSSNIVDDSAAADPDNRYYWRHDRRRLDAEAIRDALLFVSGTLNLERPGQHPFPDIKTWTWTQHAPFKDVYPSSHRSVYLMTQRIQRHPFLALFDGPDTNTTTDVRSSSIVPLQALFWMNSPLVHEQAEHFARRLLAAAPDDGGRLRTAFVLAYGREPSPTDEIPRYIDYARRYRAELTNAGVAPEQRELETWTSLARILLGANEFLYVD
jgi:cytochrome c553